MKKLLLPVILLFATHFGFAQKEDPKTIENKQTTLFSLKKMNSIEFESLLEYSENQRKASSNVLIGKSLEMQKPVAKDPQVKTGMPCVVPRNNATIKNADIDTSVDYKLLVKSTNV